MQSKTQNKANLTPADVFLRRLVLEGSSLTNTCKIPADPARSGCTTFGGRVARRLGVAGGSSRKLGLLRVAWTCLLCLLCLGIVIVCVQKSKGDIFSLLRGCLPSVQPQLFQLSTKEKNFVGNFSSFGMHGGSVAAEARLWFATPGGLWGGGEAADARLWFATPWGMKALAHFEARKGIKSLVHFEARKGIKSVAHFEARSGTKSLAHLEARKGMKSVAHFEAQSGTESLAHYEAQWGTADAEAGSWFATSHMLSRAPALANFQGNSPAESLARANIAVPRVSTGWDIIGVSRSRASLGLRAHDGYAWLQSRQDRELPFGFALKIHLWSWRINKLVPIAACKCVISSGERKHSWEKESLPTKANQDLLASFGCGWLHSWLRAHEACAVLHSGRAWKLRFGYALKFLFSSWVLPQQVEHCVGSVANVWCCVQAWFVQAAVAAFFSKTTATHSVSCGMEDHADFLHASRSSRMATFVEAVDSEIAWICWSYDPRVSSKAF